MSNQNQDRTRTRTDDDAPARKNASEVHAAALDALGDSKSDSDTRTKMNSPGFVFEHQGVEYVRRAKDPNNSAWGATVKADDRHGVGATPHHALIDTHK